MLLLPWVFPENQPCGLGRNVTGSGVNPVLQVKVEALFQPCLHKSSVNKYQKARLQSLIPENPGCDLGRAPRCAQRVCRTIIGINNPSTAGCQSRSTGQPLPQLNGHSPKQLQISSREDVPAKEPMPTVILEVKFARGEGEMKCLS